MALGDRPRSDVGPGQMWRLTQLRENNVPIHASARASLPHSAAHATVFAHSKTMGDFLPAFSGTLQRLGGAPEAMVVDRDTSIVCRIREF